MVKGAEAGGQQAAQLLRRSATEYIQAQVPEVEYDYELVVYIYGNLKGLTKPYLEANIIHQQDDLERFIRGFNMSYPLFSIIDAGNGKECADSKLRGMCKIVLIFVVAAIDLSIPQSILNCSLVTRNANTSSLVAPAIMDMHACLARIAVTRQVEESLC